MTSTLLLRWLAPASLLAAAAAIAQDSAPAPAAAGLREPFDFQSVLRGYQPFSDEKPVPWKEANETVRQVGGWREYAKEAAGANARADQPAGQGAPHNTQAPKKP